MNPLNIEKIYGYDIMQSNQKHANKINHEAVINNNIITHAKAGQDKNIH